MCGITGFLGRPAGMAAEEMVLIAGRMADALRHRGPDDAGSGWTPRRAWPSAHRRLAILDLSPPAAADAFRRRGRYVATC